MRGHHFRGILLALIVVASLFSCNDNSAELDLIKEQLQEHEQEIQALKQAVERLNQDISSLRSVLSELISGGYVASVTEDVRDNEVAGYTLSFIDGRGVYLRTSAEDESAPSVSVRKDTDQLYYWTVNGNWLLDPDGNHVLVSDDGAAPLLKADEGLWSVSVDGGSTWAAATVSSQGSAPFSSIDTSNPDYVLITLSDGTILQLPTWAAFVALRNLVSRLNTNLASLQTIVASLQDGDYLLSVSPFMDNGEQVGWMLQFANSGIVVIYSGADGKGGISPRFKIEDGWWYVSYDEGSSWTRMDKAVGDGSFIDGIDFSDESFVTLILSDGTTLPIPRFRPSDFVIDVPEEGFPIQAGEIRAIPFTISGISPGDVVVTAASDGYYHPQVSMTGPGEGVIYVDAPTPYVDGYIVVMMSNSNGYSAMRVVKFCRRSISLAEGIVFQVDENGGTLTIPWSGNYSFTASTDADWIQIMGTKASFSGQIILSVDPNPGDTPRSGVIRLYPEDNPSFASQEIFISEASKEVNAVDLHSMILTVRASYANGFTVYLPLCGRLNCKVDWGDGSSDRYEVNMAGNWVSHRYEVSEPTSFLVTVSGEVQRLYARDIPQQSGIVSVEHWGNLNTEDVGFAFYHLSSLRSVAADTEGFFSRITSCNNMFKGCTSLTDLPNGLFRSGSGIESFNSTFESCHSITSLPPALFDGCVNVTDFNSTFANCNSLASLPEDLFSYSPNTRRLSNTFQLCGLEAIPVGLFAGCPDVTGFREVFRECVSLQSIPPALFDNNRRVTDFGLTFWGCWHLKCESPYTVIGDKKVHLYERKDYPDYFATPIYCNGWYFDEDVFTDQDAIIAGGWS